MVRVIGIRDNAPDPAGQSAVDLSNPQSWNAYSYAGNNPTTNTDPSGLDCVYLGDNSVSVERGNCTAENGLFFNGTIDLNSFTYNPATQSLGFNYTGAGTGDFAKGVIGNVAPSTAPSSSDLLGAVALGTQMAAPVVNLAFQGLEAFGWIISPPAMALAECGAGAPGCATNAALSLVPGGRVFDDSEPALRKLAQKFGLQISSPTSRQVLKNLDISVDQFITRFRQASIRGKFPSEFLNQTVRQALESGDPTVRKLLTKGEFAK